MGPCVVLTGVLLGWCCHCCCARVRVLVVGHLGHFGGRRGGVFGDCFAEGTVGFGVRVGVADVGVGVGDDDAGVVVVVVVVLSVLPMSPVLLA